jgi:hypothetical protein
VSDAGIHRCHQGFWQVSCTVVWYRGNLITTFETSENIYIVNVAHRKQGVACLLNIKGREGPLPPPPPPITHNYTHIQIKIGD